MRHLRQYCKYHFFDCGLYYPLNYYANIDQLGGFVAMVLPTLVFSIVKFDDSVAALEAPKVFLCLQTPRLLLENDDSSKL